jgi:hypothetical protein
VYTWSRVKTCESDGDNGRTLTCASATSYTGETYYDTKCTYLEQRTISEFDSCEIEYNSGATDREPSFENYRYGVCQSSSGSNSADDDEVSLSQASFDGVVSGSAIAGLLLGIVITAISMLVCCSCRPGGGGGKSDKAEEAGGDKESPAAVDEEKS